VPLQLLLLHVRRLHLALLQLLLLLVVVVVLGKRRMHASVLRLEHQQLLEEAMRVLLLECVRWTGSSSRVTSSSSSDPRQKIRRIHG
jgi:hypothetical protein